MPTDLVSFWKPHLPPWPRNVALSPHPARAAEGTAAEREGGAPLLGADKWALRGFVGRAPRGGCGRPDPGGGAVLLSQSSDPLGEHAPVSF